MKKDIIDNKTYSNYRWVMQILWMLATMAQTVIWLALSPLLTTVMDDLHLDYGQGGILLTIVMLMGGVSLFLGNIIIDKMGMKKGTISALALFCLGGVISFLSHDFVTILSARILIGLGFGLIISIGGALTMVWFPAKELPLINTVNILTATVGQTLAYMITIPLLGIVKTWQNIFAVFSVFVAVILLLWLFLGKDKNTVDKKSDVKKQNGLIMAAKKKEVWLVSAAFFGNIFTFTVFSTFLPAYLQNVRGFDIAQSSNITGLLPIAGFAGALICGFGTGALKLRKPFIWPLFVMMLIGAIGIVTVPSGPLLYLSACLIGFGCAGFPPVFFTVIMELKDSTPETVAGALAWIIGLNQILVVFCPIFFNMLVPKIGMSNSFLVYCIPIVTSIVVSFMIPETGPGRSKEQAENVEMVI